MKPRLVGSAVGAAVAAALVDRVVRHRRSPAVRVWSPPLGRRLEAGGLHVRVHGDGPRVLLLLHGLAARGDFYGGAYDDLGGQWTVVVPDLLGYGASRAVGAPDGYGVAAHLSSLQNCLEELGLRGRRRVVVGHSMGANLALHVAAADPGLVDAVVCFSAPLYTSGDQARLRIRAMGRLEGLFTQDDALARAVCAWMCHYRVTAGWVAAALHPELPLTLARTGVQHTYASFRGSFDDVVAGQGWQVALEALSAHRVPVVLAQGATDPVPEPGLADELARAWPSVSFALHPTADHGLPLVFPAWCAEQINKAARAGRLRSVSPGGCRASG